MKPTNQPDPDVEEIRFKEILEGRRGIGFGKIPSLP